MTTVTDADIVAIKNGVACLPVQEVGDCKYNFNYKWACLQVLKGHTGW